MFWGLKLEEGKNYSQVVDFSFHISHASLGCESGTEFTSNLVAVHAVVEGTDYILCYLGKLPNSEVPAIQQSLNLEITGGEEITLYMDCISGEKSTVSAVHLTGYASGYDAESEEDEDDMLTALTMESDEEEEEEDLVALPPAIDELLDQDKETVVPVSRKRKRKDSQPIVTGAVTGTSLELPPAKKKKKKKKQRKDASLENGVENATEENTERKEKRKKKGAIVKTIGGTEVQDITEGSGKLAKPGRKVFVKYTGRLAHNNCIFDSNITGRRPFMFCLGKGEVVKGWDEGVKGMRVGGKRKLAIPPSQGYGSKGAPPKIPPNSRLLFDIELTAVN